MTTINNGVTQAVVLPSGNYTSPLTITSAGYVNYAVAGDAVSGIGTVVNLGTITQGDGSSAEAGYGVTLGGGGVVTNGGTGASVSTALIDGYVGVGLGTGAAGTLTNYGTVTGFQGVILNGGGTVSNGAGGTTGAIIQGYS
ncbi:MAG TPA: hypothetical protein VGL95_19500, partial [Acetobacteraceae bacterium]